MNVSKTSNQRGAALIEFVLVMPLLFLFIFGIIEFGILFYDKAVITNASREAAREWALYRPVRLTEAQIQQVVDDYTQNRMISLNAATPPDVDPKPYDLDGNLVALTAIDTGYSLNLTVTYAYDFVFLPAFMNDLIPTINLSATTIMRAE